MKALLSLFLKLGCYHTCSTSKYFTTPLCSSSQDPEPSIMFPVFHLFPLTLSLRTPHLMLVCDAPEITLFHNHNQLHEQSFRLIFRRRDKDDSGTIQLCPLNMFWLIFWVQSWRYTLLRHFTSICLCVHNSSTCFCEHSVLCAVRTETHTNGGAVTATPVLSPPAGMWLTLQCSLVLCNQTASF